MPATPSLKSQVLHSLKWVALGKIVTQIFRWVLTFWVIRLLVPEDYGVVAMADVIFGFLPLLIGPLFAPALIQAKELTQQTLKQMFGMILICYFGLFLLQLGAADAIGAYYQSENVADILKVNAWCFIIMAFSVIPSALLAREMKFKAVSIIAAIANITAAITTVILAYLGYGFWALIIGEIVSIALRTAILMVIKPITFLPSFNFSGTSKYIKFGSLLAIHSMLFYVFLHMDVAIAGRVLSAAEIGLFAIGLQFALMPQKKMLPLLKEVAFPAFSKIQDQPKLIASYVLKAQKLSLLITIPVFWGLAATVDLIIPIVLGEKWIAAVLPTMIILFVMPLRFSEELFNPALKSQRKATDMIINTIIALVIMMISVIIGAQYGAVGLALAWAMGFPIAFMMISRRNCHLLVVPYTKFLKVFFAPILAGASMITGIFIFQQLAPNMTILNLIIKIVIGASAYTATLFLVDRKSLFEIKNIAKKS